MLMLVSISGFKYLSYIDYCLNLTDSCQILEKLAFILWQITKPFKLPERIFLLVVVFVVCWTVAERRVILLPIGLQQVGVLSKVVELQRELKQPPLLLTPPVPRPPIHNDHRCTSHLLLYSENNIILLLIFFFTNSNKPFPLLAMQFVQNFIPFFIVK